MYTNKSLLLQPCLRESWVLQASRQNRVRAGSWLDGLLRSNLNYSMSSWFKKKKKIFFFFPRSGCYHSFPSSTGSWMSSAMWKIMHNIETEAWKHKLKCSHKSEDVLLVFTYQLWAGSCHFGPLRHSNCH